MTQTCILPSPLGNLRLTLEQETLSRIEFLTEDDTQNSADHATDFSNNNLFEKIIHELKEYFQHPAHVFSTPLKINGTPFQIKVWEALRQIPSGETVSYGDLAHLLKTSPRAIGNACRANRIPVIIPCHRVVGKTGWGGFSGQRTGQFLQIKKWLLQHERYTFYKNYTEERDLFHEQRHGQNTQNCPARNGG